MLFISFVSRSTLVKYRPYEELGTQICLTDMQLREASLGRLLVQLVISYCQSVLYVWAMEDRAIVQGQMVSFHQCDALIK